MSAIITKIKNEPPLAAAFLTIAVFSLPVLINICTRGAVLLPSGYTYTLSAKPLFGFIAIAIDLFLLYLFSVSPIVKMGFHNIIAPGSVRKLLILLYIAISWLSFYVFNAKLNFISSLISDPAATMLSVGGDMVEQKLLASFFFGMSGCIGYALLDEHDPALLRFSTYITMFIIVLFYFFIGRREISLMTLSFLLLVRRSKISRTYLIVVGCITFTILISILALRLSFQDSDQSMFATDSEELSPVAYSAYIIENTPPVFFKSFTEVTPIRMHLLHTTIASAYVKNQTGYNDDANNPVRGIGGITYMYGFIVPIMMLLILGILVRSITNEFRVKKTPLLKLLVIYLTFKSFNLFRNGEFPVTSIDIILFILLCLPALFLTFEARKHDVITHE
jgi:hypothetical protein